MASEVDVEFRTREGKYLFNIRWSEEEFEEMEQSAMELGIPIEEFIEHSLHEFVEVTRYVHRD